MAKKVKTMQVVGGCIIWPEGILAGFRENMSSFGHHTYYEWNPKEVAEEIKEEEKNGYKAYDKETIEWYKKVQTWLKKQGVNMKKPVLILVDW